MPIQSVPLAYTLISRPSFHHRLLVLAAERPELGPGTLRRFPARLQAAVQALLLISQHGKAMRPQQELSVEQLAVLCAWQRQQAFSVLAAGEAEAACSGAGAAAAPRPVRSSYQLHAWAAERGWAPPSQRGLPARPPVHLWPRAHLWQPLAELDEDESTVHQLAASPAGQQSAGDAALQRLRTSEAQLDARLMAGGMALPEALLEPHTMTRLPREVVLRILQMAAYPLSSWVAAEDCQLTPHEAADAAALRRRTAELMGDFAPAAVHPLS